MQQADEKYAGCRHFHIKSGLPYNTAFCHVLNVVGDSAPLPELPQIQPRLEELGMLRSGGR